GGTAGTGAAAGGGGGGVTLDRALDLQTPDRGPIDQGRDQRDPLRDAFRFDRNSADRSMVRDQRASIEDLMPTLRDAGGQVCARACDCAAGLRCLEGRCVLGERPLFCCAGETCPAGEACETLEGRLERCPASRCRSACDCEMGLSCYEGLCQPGGEIGFCCEADPCPGGARCEDQQGVEGVCLGDRCQSACDCDPGFSCAAGRCILRADPVFCCDQACPPGAACETPEGTPGLCEESPCETACDCSPGLACLAGRCTLGATPVFCCNSERCPFDADCEDLRGRLGLCSDPP
ncbi:MAG: hypothetical protein VYD19_01790, partial [Myxococcota bacterium]|nr:hypothetical protein [Myxococcota bacterium]